LHNLQRINILTERIENKLIFGGPWWREAERGGEVPGTEAGCYAQREDAGVPEVGPADAGLEGEGEVERMLAGTEEGLVG
jgi:hypothetical protein